MIRPLLAAAILLAAAAAQADPQASPGSAPVASSVQPRPAPPEPPARRAPAHTADDVTGAPLPGQESGRTDPGDPGPSAIRRVGRAVLYVPKLLVEAAFLPLQTAFLLSDRYQLQDRYYRTFYTADHKIRLVPTAQYQTGFGVSVGGHFENTDTFGEGEHTSFEATWGGTYRAHAALWLDTGERFGRLQLGVGGNFDRRPREPFFGIGNVDTGPEPADLLDPVMPPVAIQTHYRYQEQRANALAGVRVFDDLHLVARGAVTELKTSPSTTTPSIQKVYDPAGLVGFETPVAHLYGELELLWDGRRRATSWEPLNVHAEGSLASMSFGRVHRLSGPGADFWHYTLELQHFIRLGSGPRTLALRLRGEGVTGELADVPFFELPALGGDFLRGYEYNRFRDRVAAFGTAQYLWDLSHFVDAYVFVDAGRVYPSLEDLTFDDLRVGYGIGLELHSDHGFLMEASLASSSDGGVIVTASFNPLLDERPRWR